MVSTQELIRAAKRLNDAEDAVVDAHAAVIKAAKEWHGDSVEPERELHEAVDALLRAEAKLRAMEK